MLLIAKPSLQTFNSSPYIDLSGDLLSAKNARLLLFVLPSYSFHPPVMEQFWSLGLLCASVLIQRMVTC